VVVIRVYLDQNKWIDLTRAAKGRAGGERFRDVLDVARACVKAGDASFPLDISRYIETSKRGSWQSRQELVETMVELSRFHTIAPSFKILPAEIDAALHARFGRPNIPRTAQVFGRGVNHAIGGGLRTDGRFELPEKFVVPPGFRSQADAVLRSVLEYFMLVGPPPDMELSQEFYDARAAMTQDVSYSQGETDLAARLVEHGFAKQEKLNRAMHATELGDILRPVVEALLRAGINPDHFIDTLGREGLTTFVQDLPTRAVTTKLRKDKHAQGQQRWEPNDLNDIVSLPIAAVYCDIVVTEKQWVNRMQRAGVERRYDTKFLANLSELTEALVGFTRT